MAAPRRCRLLQTPNDARAAEVPDLPVPFRIPLDPMRRPNDDAETLVRGHMAAGARQGHAATHAKRWAPAAESARVERQKTLSLPAVNERPATLVDSVRNQ